MQVLKDEQFDLVVIDEAAQVKLMDCSCKHTQTYIPL